MVTVALTQCNVSSKPFSAEFADLLYSQTAIYAQGVGLGASKAKEFGKYAEGYSGYVHMAQDAVSAIGLQGTEMTTAYHKFLLLLSQCRLGSAMGARRDSNCSHSYRLQLTFWFIYVIRVTWLLSRNHIYFQQPFKTCESSLKLGIVQISSRHKARIPIIGARKSASALRVALKPAFVFCAIAPVGWAAPFHPGRVSETTALVDGRTAVAGPC